MFLALREIFKEKARFVLIAIVIVFVGYLTYFLTGLAYGLAKSYTNGLEQWRAGKIILSDGANNNLARSLLSGEDYNNFANDKTAKLGYSTATLKQEKSADQDVALFGIDTSDFYRPEISEGENFAKNNQVVVGADLKKTGVKIGSEISFKNSEKKYKVVGFVENANFQTAPIIYLELAEWRELATEISGMVAMRDETTVNAILAKNDFDDEKIAKNSDLKILPIGDFFYELPGYRPQVLTFGLMIGFLVGIASFVLAVFMYILTLQKKSIFGVLKAEGVPNHYIAGSVVIQAIILNISGLIVGLGLTLLSAYFLQGIVPFLVNWWFFAGIFALFLICTIFGSLASVRAVTKIDPVEAIG